MALSFFLFIIFYQISSQKIKSNIPKFVLASMLIVVFYIAYHVPFNELHRYNANAQNFQNVLHATVQVYLGKTIFFDLISQYGGFPFFIKPILILTGASVTSVSSIFAFILMIVFLIWGFILYKIIENKLLVLFGFFAYLYIHLFSTGLWPYQLTFFYYPIRIFFPALMILTSFIYFKDPNKRNFFLSTIVLSLGLIWNADVGIVCFLAFALVASFDKFCQENTLFLRLKYFFIEIIKCFIVPILLLSIVSLYYKLTLGSWADYSMQFAVHEFYIKGRSVSGLSGLTLNGTWIFIILIYIVSLNYSIYSMFRRREYIDKIILLLTIFGIGTFSYHAYTHVPQVAARVSYPAIFIIILFLDRELRKDSYNFFANNIYNLKLFKSLYFFKSPLNLLSSLLIFFFCFCSSLLFMEHKVPFNSEHIKIHEFYFKNPQSSKTLWFEPGKNGKRSTKIIPMSDYVADENLTPRWIDRFLKVNELIKRHKIDKDQKVIIFSTWDAYIYMKLKMKSPLSIANSYHIMQANQAKEVLDYINSKQADWIFFDKDPFLLHAEYSYWTNDIPKVINENYDEIEFLPLMHNHHDGWNETTLILYKKKQ